MKLIMTKGLPGSGKTTWAEKYLEEHPNTLLVNKDDLRGMLFNSEWTGHREKMILSVRDFIVTQGLKSGRDVIVHDTNFAPKHETRLRQLAKELKAEFVIQDFTQVPLETCIKQDLLRFTSVGERVIRQMYNDWLRPTPPVVEWDLDLPNCIICDLDGTLALFDDKNPYERDFINDKCNSSVRYIISYFKKLGDEKIFIFSGRSGKFKKETEEWLQDEIIFYDGLVMREENDKRKDSIVKKEMYEKHIKGKYNVQFVLDDRNQVVEMWRSLGLTCLQVADGDF